MNTILIDLKNLSIFKNIKLPFFLFMKLNVYLFIFWKGLIVMKIMSKGKNSNGP